MKEGKDEWRKRLRERDRESERKKEKSYIRVMN